MTRFDDIDLVEVPDQWDEILQRAVSAPVADLRPDSRRRRGVWLGAAAVVLVVAGAVAVAVGGDDSATQVATTQVATTDPSVGDRAAELPLLVCTGGELRAGSIPVDAVMGDDPIFDVEQFEGVHPSLSWSWRVDDLDVQLVVPGIPWVDFVGERTEALVDPPGTLAYMWDESGERPTANAIVETGLPEPCARAEVIVAGGTEAERVAAATGTARALSWQLLDGSPTADEVVDEATVRQWSLDRASEMLSAGVHRADVSVTAYRSDDRIGRLVGSLDGREPEPAWSMIIRTAPAALVMAGDPESAGRDLLLLNFGAESKEWMMSAGVSGPADQAMRDRERSIPALVVGSRDSIVQHDQMREAQRRAQEQREQELQRREARSPD